MMRTMALGSSSAVENMKQQTRGSFASVAFSVGTRRLVNSANYRRVGVLSGTSLEVIGNGSRIPLVPMTSRSQPFASQSPRGSLGACQLP